MPRTRVSGGGNGRPTALKLLAGDKGSQINRDEPKPEEGVPQCPTDDPDVLEIWDYTVQQLRVMRVLTMADRDALYVYCQAVAMHNEAARQLREQGMFLNTPKGPMRNSATMVMKEASQVIRQLAHSFGMTPQARSVIKMGDQKPAEEPKTAARLLSG